LVAGLRDAGYHVRVIVSTYGEHGFRVHRTGPALSAKGRPNRLQRRLVFLAAATLLAGLWSPARASRTVTYKQVAVIRGPGIPPPSSVAGVPKPWLFDISWVDDSSGRYYLGDSPNDGVDVFDARLLAYVARASFGAIGGPSGVVTDDTGSVWAAGGDSAVHQVDARTLKIVASISTKGSGSADELGFDPRDHEVLVSNPDEVPAPFVTAVSTTDHRWRGQVALAGAGPRSVEQTTWDPVSGDFLVPLSQPLAQPPIGEMLWIDPHSLRIVKRASLGTCLPTGTAIGPNRQMLVGCRTNPIILNLATGHVVATVGGIEGVDEVAYDPVQELYFGPAIVSPGRGPVLAVIDARRYTVVSSPPVIVGAHSVAVSPFTGRVFVPESGVGIAVFARS
jgi:DNA-binding beta-propeller fold protein YncE